MSVAVVRYHEGDSPRWGVARDGRVAPLSGSWPTTRAFLLDGGPRAARGASADAFTLDLEGLALASPITPDAQIVCQAANYAMHRKESGINTRPTANVLFRKASSCLCSARDDIVRPAHVQLLDYEIELGLVIGAEIDRSQTFAPSDLPSVVVGLTVFNDISARDVQIPQGQFYKGKSYRTFGPTGPFLVLVDGEELARWPELVLELAVDGEIRQSCAAGEMLYRPAETLTEISELMDLRPGDVLATGTPGGVALQPPSAFVQKIAGLLPEATKWRKFLAGQSRSDRYLKPGQTVTARIATPDGTLDLGEQRNRIVGP